MTVLLQTRQLVRPGFHSENGTFWLLHALLGAEQ